jgi:hypothetical protein
MRNALVSGFRDERADSRDGWVEEEGAPFLFDQMYSAQKSFKVPEDQMMEWERKERTYRSIPFLVITRLLRSFRGLNFVGIDSHVLRPIITAFWVFCGLVVVTLSSALTLLPSFLAMSLPRLVQVLHAS